MNATHQLTILFAGLTAPMVISFDSVGERDRAFAQILGAMAGKSIYHNSDIILAGSEIRTVTKNDITHTAVRIKDNG
jgi:hypothetical protein